MVILKERATVGPKGQVVIPAPFRKALGVAPGITVAIGLEDNRIVIEKYGEEIVERFRELAKKINLKEPVDADKSYDEMMEEKWKKLLT